MPMTVDLAKTPSFRLDGKRALVTGGGRGIGLAAASALAAAGAHVTLAARTKAEIEEAAAAIRARGEKADALVLDVTDVEAAQKALAAAEPFNILINNAGTNRPSLSAGRQGRGLRRHLGAQRARRLLRGAGGGAAADRGEAARLDHQHLLADGPCRRRAAHGLLRVSKHAMEGFTKAMAIELAPHNIRVNSARPDLPRDADDQAVLREQGVPRRGAVARSSSAGSGSSTNSPARSCSSPPMLVADDRLGAGARRRLDRGVRGSSVMHVIPRQARSARARDGLNLASAHDPSRPRYASPQDEVPKSRILWKS